MSTLVTRMKAYREQLSLSQNELAKKVGVRRETIVRLERGMYNPSLRLAMNISKEFGKNIEDVFAFIDDADDEKANTKETNAAQTGTANTDEEQPGEAFHEKP